MLTVRSNQKDFSFCENDIEKSVCQNVSLIISTRKGSVPMYREFGINMEYLDRPIPAAEALIFAEISKGVEQFEPRAKLVDVTLEPDGDKLVVIAVIKLRSEDDEQEYGL